MATIWLDHPREAPSQESIDNQKRAFVAAVSSILTFLRENEERLQTELYAFFQACNPGLSRAFLEKKMAETYIETLTAQARNLFSEALLIRNEQGEIVGQISHGACPFFQRLSRLLNFLSGISFPFYHYPEGEKPSQALIKEIHDVLKIAEDPDIIAREAKDLF